MADSLLPLAAKILWDESKPLRKLLYSKLPFARDAAKRSYAEEELGKLVEDCHKLARSLSPPQAEEAIEKRIDLFRADLIKGKIPPDQAETLVVRGEMFVRMLVTEPITEAALLKVRVSELERILTEQSNQLAELERNLSVPKRDSQILALWVGFLVLLILEAVQIAARFGGAAR